MNISDPAYFPDPTKKPTAEDYDWAKNLNADNLRLRIDWALRQVAVRGINEIDFCEMAGVNRTYIRYLRSGKREKPTPDTWNKFIDCLQVNESHVPDCVWRRQSLFPYNDGYLHKIIRDMNEAGFTPYTLQSARGTHSAKSVLGKVKNPDHPYWFESLCIIYTTLDGLAKLPAEASAQFFPYDPRHNPQDAARKMIDLWRLQEMAGADEFELSELLGRKGDEDRQAYIRGLKLSEGMLSVRDYAIMVHALHNKKHLKNRAEIKDAYQGFFPFSDCARQRLALMATRLGITYNTIHECNRARNGDKGFSQNYPISMLKGNIRYPSQLCWRQLVLAIQDAESDLKNNFLKAWDKLYGERGEYSHLLGGETAKRAYEKILECGETILPIPFQWLAPALSAGITFGGRMGKPVVAKESKRKLSNQRIVHVNSPITIQGMEGEIIELYAGAKLIIHEQPGYALPVVIMHDTKELGGFGVKLPHGCAGACRVRGGAHIGD